MKKTATASEINESNKPRSDLKYLRRCRIPARKRSANNLINTASMTLVIGPLRIGHE